MPVVTFVHPVRLNDLVRCPLDGAVVESGVHVDGVPCSRKAGK